MEEIDKKIAEVQQYFKEKIINGLYEIVSYDDYYLKLIVDNKYLFTFWIANGLRGFQEASELRGEPSWTTKFSVEEKEIIYKQLNERLTVIRECKAVADRQEKIAKLTAELEELKAEEAGQ